MATLPIMAGAPVENQPSEQPPGAHRWHLCLLECRDNKRGANGLQSSIHDIGSELRIAAAPTALIELGDRSTCRVLGGRAALM